MELTELAGVLQSASDYDTFNFCEVLEKISGEGKCHDFAWCDDCKKFIMDSIASELEKSKARIMPEGMEWLRFDDGYPVRIGDEVTVTVHDEDGAFDRTLAIRSIKHKQDGVLLEGTKNEMVMLSRGERVKRPAPKVLDADGAEIRVGDTVWSTAGEFDGKRTVKSIHVDDGESPYALFNEYSEPWSCLCCCLTHRAPVLAADGKPLREGETVYLLHGDWCGVYPCYGYHGGEKIKVVELHTCHSSGGIRCENDTGFACYPQPSQLTHERPDSWERLEEDARKLAVDYWGCFNFDCDDCPAEIDGERPSERFDTGVCDYAQQIDLVRRAKALAGVSE